MGQKRFALKALKVITIMTPTLIVLSLLFDMSTLSFVGGSVWSLSSLGMLILVAFIIWAVVTVASFFIHDIWDRLSGTKTHRQGQERGASKPEADVVDAVAWTVK